MGSPDSLTGQPERCPECGNVTTVPSSPPPQAPPPPLAPPTPVVSQSATARSPAISQAPSTSDNVLLIKRPAMFRNNPIGFIAAVLLIPLFGLGLLILLQWWLSCRATLLTVTERRTILRKGILAKHTNEVRHIDLRNIQVKQGMLQRLYGVGSLELSTAGQAGVELAVSGIPDAAKVGDLIRRCQG